MTRYEREYYENINKQTKLLEEIVKHLQNLPKKNQL